jgi:Fic family protein
MADLDRLIRYEPDSESHYDVTVLARAPIVHAQFEAIHPFIDGNGRIGRLLLPLMFDRRGSSAATVPFTLMKS